MTENCQGCRFFLPANAERGFCRRYPATLSVIVPPEVKEGGIETQITTSSNFPTMMNSGWCGEYQPKTTH